MDTNYYVYCHLTLNNEVFYIGMGTKNRAHIKIGRKKAWQDIAENGYTVKIIQTDLTKDEACALEKSLILEYGRVFNNTGLLINKYAGVDFINPINPNHKHKRIYDSFEDRKILDFKTNEVYNSVLDVSVVFNLHVNTVIRHLENLKYNPKLTITYLD